MSNLIQHKPFRSLLITQFFEALNDNLMKFVFAALMVESIARTHSTRDLALSGVLFTLPFVLFSGLGGYLADRFSKSRVIVWIKVVEVFVAILSGWALYTQNVSMMLGILFLMGTHSALFGPSKYGIIPELVPDEKLSEANGLIQSGTYLAILLGQSCYGILLDITQPHYHVIAAVLTLVAVIGLLSSLGIGRTPSAIKASGPKVSLWSGMKESVGMILADRAIFLSVLGLAFFGCLGAMFQLNILLYGQEMMGLDHLRAGFLVGSLTVGMGLGCFLAGRWSDRQVELGLVPFGAIGISAFAMLLSATYSSYVSTMVVLSFLGLSAGFYVVPLNSLLQENAQADHRGKIIGLNNMLSFSAMMLGALTLNLLHDHFRINPAQIFLTMGLTMILAAGYALVLLPYAFFRFGVWILAHTVYKLKIMDRQHVPLRGGALLVCNHVSYLDAVLLAVAIQRPVRFLVSTEIYNIPVLKPALKMAGVIPIIYNSGPKELIHSLNTAKDALRNGEIVCIFPEGQLTRTGNMLKFNRGMEKIMEGVEVPIIPVNIDRIWGSIFSFERGKYFFKFPKMLPYPLTISFGRAMPAGSSVFSVRRKIMELGAEAFGHRLNKRQTLPELFWRESRKHPLRFCMADSGGKSVTRGQALISAVVLVDKLRNVFNQDCHPCESRDPVSLDNKNETTTDSVKDTGAREECVARSKHSGMTSNDEEDQYVGILIPPSIGGVLTNVAVSMLNKVPVNLNYTLSAETMTSVIRQCGMKRVVTSKIFVHKMKIELPVEMIFIEDILKTVSGFDRVKGFLKVFGVPWFVSYPLVFGPAERSVDDLATVMFTSGSTGEPKGVMLSHANIVSNIEGLYQVFPFGRNDVIMGVLPLFHSFGFTATMWLPLVAGFGAVYHNNPLEPRMVGQLIHKRKATILMATPTFLQFYTRQCEKEQLASLKLVVVGAEKLKEQIALAFQEKFGLQALEGYGCTELSPIVSLNLPDYTASGVRQKSHKPGSIGLPLPGIAVKIVHMDTGEALEADQEGLLLVKGPNVMRGYLGQDDLTREVISDGWYRTGDIAKVDVDGFIRITDRLSRFSKIGGEMVPHIKVEDAIHQALGTTEQTCVVVSVPDEKRGEKLAVAHLPGVDVEALIMKLREAGLPNLWIPSSEMFFKIEAIPMLGTGKVDVKRIKLMVEQNI